MFAEQDSTPHPSSPTETDEPLDSPNRTSLDSSPCHHTLPHTFGPYRVPSTSGVPTSCSRGNGATRLSPSFHPSHRAEASPPCQLAASRRQFPLRGALVADLHPTSLAIHENTSEDDPHISGRWPRRLAFFRPRSRQSIPKIADDVRQPLQADLRCRRYLTPRCSLSMPSVSHQ